MTLYNYLLAFCSTHYKKVETLSIVSITRVEITVFPVLINIGEMDERMSEWKELLKLPLCPKG